MKTLFMAWQTKDKTRNWFPIGRLNVNQAGSEYTFEYTRGAQEALDHGFAPLLAFPDLKGRYTSSELFPLFQNRLLSKNRPEFKSYIQSMAISDSVVFSPIEVLAVSGGERQTDSLQIFPKIELNSSGQFLTRFFVHGIRYLSGDSILRLASLLPSERLNISVENDNPKYPQAVKFHSNDDILLGYSPRYLVNDLAKSIDSKICDIQANVVKVNGGDTPPNRKLLVEISGCYPKNVEPMSSDQYQPFTALTPH